MKFRILGLILLSNLIGYSVSASDYIHTVQKGDTLWKIAKNFNTSIVELIANNDIKNPDLILIGQRLNIREKRLGYTPPTGYQSRTTGYISNSATTIPVVSTKDKAGVQIALSNISSASSVKVYLSLEPGTSKEEPILCTGITASSWTNCTRGLVFQGSSESNSTTIAVAHNAGATIIITNIGQFFNQYASVNDSITVTGTWTFNTDPIASSTTHITGDPASYVTLYAMNQATTTGGSNASTLIKGVSQEATDSMLQSSSSTGSTGARTFSNGGSFAQTSTANKVPVSNGSGYIDARYVPTTTLATLDANSLVIQNPTNATTTATAGKIPLADASSTLDSWTRKKFGGDGTDGALSVASSTTTTIDLGTNKVTVKNYSSLTINGTLNFTNASSSGSAIFLKSQGNCIINGKIFTTSTGAAGSAEPGSGASQLDGVSTRWLLETTKASGGTGGARVAFGGNHLDSAQGFIPQSFMGAGGSSGRGDTVNCIGGAGSRGAGILIIECNGQNNTFIGTISATGTVGVSGSGNGNCTGGGGGGGGFVELLYNGSLTNSGTILTAGGNGGLIKGTGGGYSSGGGGGSFSAGSNGGADATGGTGGDGYSIISKNYWWY